MSLLELGCAIFSTKITYKIKHGEELRFEQFFSVSAIKYKCFNKT